MTLWRKVTVTEENELELHDVVEEVNMSLLYFIAFSILVSSKNLFAWPFHQHFTLDTIASTKN